MWSTGDESSKFKAQVTGFTTTGAGLLSVEKRHCPSFTGGSGKQFLAEPPGKMEANFYVGNKTPDDFPLLHSGHGRDSFPTISREMLLQCKTGMAYGQKETNKLLDKNSDYVEANILSSQPGNYQFTDPSRLSTGLQTKDVIFQNPGLNNLESMLYHHESTPQSNSLVVEYHQVPCSQHFMIGMPSQAEAGGKHLPYATESNISTGKVQDDLNSNTMVNLAFRDLPQPNDVCSGQINTSCGSNKNPEGYRSGVHKTQFGADATNVDGRNFSDRICYPGTCSEVIKNDYGAPKVGICGFSVNMTIPPVVPAAMERNEAYGSNLYTSADVHSSNNPWGNFCAKEQENTESGMREKPSDCKEALLDCSKLNRNSNQPHASRKPDDSDNGCRNSSSKVEASRESSAMVHRSVALGETQHSESQISLGMVSTSKMSSAKVAQTITGTLWDGMLQLNTSTVVSVVAVFKSGEKASEVNWSKHVEVKGKVRMEAFEKFVQELPRSRTRALMVISIYWKAGSSEAGFMGMKEVAKSYKEGQRVGFAQLCPGIDLYVCPRSDAIITILAKYGFFKGMAAVEEDQDSLIGCVVWRRNHSSSDFALKKTEKTEISSSDQPHESPCESAISDNAEHNLPKVVNNQVLQDLMVPTGASSPQKPSYPENESPREMKNKTLTTVHNTVSSNDNSSVPVLEPLLARISSVTQQLSLPSHKMDMLPEDPRKCSAPAIPQFDHDMTLGKSQVGSDASVRVLSELCEKIDDGHSSSRKKDDDDDLPEFDFGKVYGIPLHPGSSFLSSNQNQQTTGVTTHNQQFSVQKDMLPQLPNVKPLPQNEPHRSHSSLSLSVVHDVSHRILPLKEAGVPAYSSQTVVQTTERPRTLGVSGTVMSPAVNSSLTEKLIETTARFSRSNVADVYSLTAQASNASVAQRRHIWDDEDDMPEWAPPNISNEQWPFAPTIPLQSQPPLQSIPPPISRPITLSSFPSSSPSTQPGASMLPPPPPLSRFQYEHNISRPYPSGILPLSPQEGNYMIPMQKMPAVRFGRSDWKDSLENDYSQSKRPRRASGWDVKPWEVKSDPLHIQNERR